MPAALREHARLRPDETAFTFVDYIRDDTGITESLTWSQLHRRASRVARELKSCGSTGDRTVIVAPQGLEYVTAFLGALQAGLIAVPLSEPNGGAADERVGAVLRDASPSAVLTTSSHATGLADHVRCAFGGAAPPVIDLGALVADSGPGSEDFDDSRGVAHLQYTSGSTRTPAGVMVSHRNIQANVAQMMGAYLDAHDGVPPPETTVVSWLPLFHDMGLLLGICIPILAGVPAVLTDPLSFLQRPARWMQLLAGNGRAFSAAPNVAFELATRRTMDDDLAGLDLGNVLGVVTGAERVHTATLERFVERFSRFNLDPKVIRPSYGLAEATLYVATRESGEAPVSILFDPEGLAAGQAIRILGKNGTPLVSYGVPQSPVVRIVDPETCTECPDESVGEIWVTGDNVAYGYWRKPEESERTFSATIVDASKHTPAGPWLRTGDLGFISGGELFIVGRIKDLLVIYGRNYSPDDIEATIQEVTPGRCVAIAAHDDGGTDQLVAIVELKVPGDSDEAARKATAVRRDVIAAISRTHNLSVTDVVLVQPGSIPLTTSGKVRRRDCQQLYLGDGFTRIALPAQGTEQQSDRDNDRSPTDQGFTERLRRLRRDEHELLVEMVCSHVAAVLGELHAEDIDPARTFTDLGLDSVKSTEMLDRIKAAADLDLPATVPFDHPTPRKLADHLSHVARGPAATAAPANAYESRDEPVAVVGMACRFPGGVDSPAALWDLVVHGKDAVGGFPADRGWNLGDLFDPDPDAVGRTYVTAGAFLSDAGGFDSEFFGISSREAAAMDPQQRLLLEVTWEALEAARIDPTVLAGTDTAVYVGAWSQPCGATQSDSAEGYAMTGLSTSVASGRIAYLLGLQGPAITIDTACSSSMVATHMACQSLRSGESTLALAAGVTVMTTPSILTEFSRRRGLAPDGRCKAFAADADGTSFSEGVGVLVLERLSDARRNNHPVLAVIAGSAINQDGASNGLTAPNALAQQRVIAQAAASAGIALDQVDAVEAHGTGTALGDPIEAGAVIATYGAARSAEQPLWLGSVKSNIGHTQAAAGIAGIIKMVEALNHQTLPPTLHARRPGPYIDAANGTVRLLNDTRPWPGTAHPRTAAVSSFGISGTNAHLILREAPAPTPGSPAAQVRSAACSPSATIGPLWPLSARTPAALRAQADRLRHHLIQNPDIDLTDVAHSLATTRCHHPHRATVTVPAKSTDVRQDLLEALDALQCGRPHRQLTRHHHRGPRQARVTFVFSGHGCQYPGMGRELYELHPVFANAVDDCDEALLPYTGWSVRDVLCERPDAPPVDRVDVVQPAIFAMTVALATVLRHHGIFPDAVIGHSQGEIAAAHIAGALSLPDAAKVVGVRGQVCGALSGAGGMVSVMLNVEELRPRLETWSAALTIAAINGPSHTVVSGDLGVLKEFTTACESDGIWVRPVAIGYASHSTQIDSVRERLMAEWAGVTARMGDVPLYSTVGPELSPEPLDTSTMTADYWYRNLRQPVHLHERVAALAESGEHTFVEVSPHPVMAPAITDILAQDARRGRSTVITTLRRDRSGADMLATAVAHLHNRGHSPAWPTLYAGVRAVALPTYPFEHRQYGVGRGHLYNAFGVRPGDTPPMSVDTDDDLVRQRELAAALAGRPHQERLDTLTAAVFEATADALGHPDPYGLDPDQSYQELGMDSLAALELRNALRRGTGLNLPTTIVFDHPTPRALAIHLADVVTDPSSPALPKSPVSSTDGPVDNRLDHVDQASFRMLRAVPSQIFQVTWMYDRPIDTEGLRRFHHNLGHGLLGRRIERSPLPFARDRWVIPDACEPIDFIERPRRRADLNRWVDERLRLPVDPEWGPSWHLGVLPLEDGGTAVSLVVSHGVIDAVGLGQAIADAARGQTRNLGFPSARSRRLTQALREDLGQTARDLPGLGRAALAAGRSIWRDRKHLMATSDSARPERRDSGDETVEVPSVTAYLDLMEWDLRAKGYGISSNSLVAAVACRLAVQVGRVHDDGTVMLRFPVSLRTENDTRGNALTQVDVSVTAAHAVTDLKEIHARITETILRSLENTDDEALATLPLAVLVPVRLNRKLAASAQGGASLPVIVSNLGDLPPAASQPDGTDATHLDMRAVTPGLTRSVFERMGGYLFVGSGRSQGRIFIKVSAFTLGRQNTEDELRNAVSETFAGFELTAKIN